MWGYDGCGAWRTRPSSADQTSLRQNHQFPFINFPHFGKTSDFFKKVKIHYDNVKGVYSAAAAAAAAKSLQSHPTLCDPIDGSPPGSAVLGILQARTLEWVAISFSNA